MSIADNMHDLELHYSDPDRTFTETWTVSCSDLPHDIVAGFLAAVHSGSVHYRKSAEDPDWSLL